VGDKEGVLVTEVPPGTKVVVCIGSGKLKLKLTADPERL
jgi:hypothetical protein